MPALQGEIPLEETGEFAGKIIVERKIDRVLGGAPVEHVAAEREHHIAEREEGEQHRGGDREGIDMHLGFHRVARGGTEELDAGAAFRSQQGQTSG